jgi:hypothetical protein
MISGGFIKSKVLTECERIDTSELNMTEDWYVAIRKSCGFESAAEVFNICQAIVNRK